MNTGPGQKKDTHWRSLVEFFIRFSFTAIPREVAPYVWHKHGLWWKGFFIKVHFLLIVCRWMTYGTLSYTRYRNSRQQVVECTGITSCDHETLFWGPDIRIAGGRWCVWMNLNPALWRAVHIIQLGCLLCLLLLRPAKKPYVNVKGMHSAKHHSKTIFC